MKRTLLEIRVVALAVSTALLAATAVADPPDILRDYRFIPRHSTVQVTGGFAGVDQTLHVLGKFGLVTGYEGGFSCLAIGCPPPPTHIPFAEFVDVRAILFDPRAAAPLPTPGLDLDQTLNLSGLHGTFQVPSHLFFQGRDGQGQPMKLEAILSDRLIHLVGANDPGCCDFFNYKIDAYAHLTPFADFNFDGMVNAADYTAWRNHEGLASGATLDDGDADGDGDVDGDDYLIWKGDVGTSIDMSALAASGSGGAAIAAPEPSTLLILTIGFVLIAARAQRTRSLEA